jgi:hypothetical protein
MPLARVQISVCRLKRLISLFSAGRVAVRALLVPSIMACMGILYPQLRQRPLTETWVVLKGGLATVKPR